MKFRNEREGAVSPVVGVMLMLSVTVLIAAIVSTYAGGFTTGAEKSPQCSIRATPNLDQHKIYFEHTGGDPFMLGSITVILREHDNKTSISVLDAAENHLVQNFTEVGSSDVASDTTIQAGDNFFIESAGWKNDEQFMKFGNVNLTKDAKITWMIVDKGTSKTISTGSFYL